MTSRHGQSRKPKVQGPDGATRSTKGPTAPAARAIVPWALLAICLLFLCHVWLYNYVSDDAFITLRYARNVARGNGLVFNVGERVEGFTSLLWTLLLAGLGSLHADMLGAARIGGVLAGLSVVILAYRLFAVVNPGRPPSFAALFAPAMLAFSGPFACWAASGMETPLFVCLVAAGCLAAMSGRAVLSAALTAACIVARPEGILVFALLGAFQIHKSGLRGYRSWIPWLLGGGTAALAVLVFRRSYYGDWLPNTYYAKTGGGWSQIVRGWGYLQEYAADDEGLPLMALPVAYFLLAGDSAARLLAASVVAFWAATVWAGGDGLPMYRFALTPLPFLLVLQGAGIERLYRHVAGLSPSVKRPLNACVVLCVFLWAFVYVSRPVAGSHYARYEYQKRVEIPRWISVGQWLKENRSPGDSLAAAPIGAVSYYSDLKAFDLLGLTDKHIARRQMPNMGKGWAGHEKHDGQYILGRKPTCLLLGNIDVTPQARDPEKRPFIPYANPDVWERERDFYEGDLLLKTYAPRSAEIAPGQWLNFYELKPEYR